MPLLPSLDAHEELVRLIERRVKRAGHRRAAAEAEEAEALQALTEARNDRSEWIRANPDPQIMMF
jgi:squalene cyclase